MGRARTLVSSGLAMAALTLACGLGSAAPTAGSPIATADPAATSASGPDRATPSLTAAASAAATSSPAALPVGDPAEFVELAASARQFPMYSTDARLSPAGDRLALAVRTFNPEFESVPQEGVLIYSLDDLMAPISWPRGDAATLVVWGQERLYLGFESSRIERVDPASGEGQQLADFRGGFITALALAPQRERLAAASFEVPEPKLLDPETGEELSALPPAQNNVRDIAWSPSGDTLAVSDGNILRLWDGETLLRKHQLEGHEHHIQQVRWSPDGALVASASEDGTVRVWDADSGELVHRLWPAQGNLRALDFSADGRYLAAGSNNGAIPVWEVESGDLVVTLQDDWAVHTVEWTPDGRLVSASIPLSNNLGGRVLLWGIP